MNALHSKILLDEIVTNLILLVHDKKHADISDDFLQFIEDKSEVVTVDLYRGIYSDDPQKVMFSFSENINVAKSFALRNNSKIVKVEASSKLKGFCLYKFLEGELTCDEIEDIKELLVKEKEWIILSKELK